MKKVAEKHGLVCLLHEKPFAGVNGSGKHNNWSISAPGLNLLDPGKKPMENLRFLVFLAAVIKAVDEYQDLLRVSVASPGNDHRLGANEAPPAIISMFVGDELESVIEALSGETEYQNHERQKMDLGVAVLPKFNKDNTDRNRTSPFAFTGNKFEFRAPGSNQNLSDVNTVLNVAVAKELREFADVLETADDFEGAAMEMVKKTIKEHKRIIFNGNGYSEEWPVEAEARGLENLKSTVDAMPVMLREKNIKLMNDFGVMSPTEMHARYEVGLENYSKVLNIEALTMLEMANQQIVPAIISYEKQLSTTIASMKAVNPNIPCKAEESQLATLADCADSIWESIDELRTARKAAHHEPDALKSARMFHDEVIPIMDKLRAAADHAEQVCGEGYWPLPTYTKMLWYVKD
jgi:glutamine synthetase